jgi:hypothetical protein
MCKFIKALPNNKLFNMGFHKISRKDKCCYCPCSKVVSKEWRLRNDIDFKVGKSEVCSDKPFTSEKLMEHLNMKAKQGNLLHQFMLIYNMVLYNKYWAVNLDHKALYTNRWSVQYEDAKRVQDNSMFINDFPVFLLDMVEIIENGKQEESTTIKQNKDNQSKSNSKVINNEQNKKENQDEEQSTKRSQEVNEEEEQQIYRKPSILEKMDKNLMKMIINKYLSKKEERKRTM